MGRALVVALGGLGVVGLMIAAGPDSREQVRLRAHFDSVLIELRSRDVSGMSAERLESRQRLIDWLADYRDAGRFPLNDRYANGPTPIFRDARGVTCAMAYLIERSGRRDIVDRISATRNLAYIPELANDASLVAWLDSTGISVSEAARIQPYYEENKMGNRASLAGATAVLSGISLGMAASNAFRPAEPKGFAGILIGGITLLYGGAISQDYPAFAAINVVSGALSVVTGIYAAFRPRDTSAPKPPPPAKELHEWSPLTQWSPQRGTRVGLAVRF